MEDAGSMMGDGVCVCLLSLRSNPTPYPFGYLAAPVGLRIHIIFVPVHFQVVANSSFPFYTSCLITETAPLN